MNPSFLHWHFSAFTLIDFRVARYLSDLFASLLRMSIGGAGRARRGQIPYQMAPPQSGIALIELMMTNFRKAMEWQPPKSSNPKLW